MTKLSVIIIDDFNTPLSVIYRITREKIIREIEDVNIINPLDLLHVYTEHSTQEQPNGPGWCGSVH